MSDRPILYEEGARIDRCKWCGQNMVPVEPAGTLTVEGADYGAGWGEIKGDHGNHGFPTHLPPGKYLIVEVDDE